jgi:hypothetical protein
VGPLPPVLTAPPPAAHQTASVQTPVVSAPPTAVQTSPPAGGAPKKEEKRTLAEKWGTAYYQGKLYDSPNELATKLGIKVKGYHSTVEAFRKQGYEVYGEKPGTEPVKGGKFTVVKKGGGPTRPAAPTPEQPSRGGTSEVRTYKAEPPKPKQEEAVKPLNPAVEKAALAVWTGLPVIQRSNMAVMAGLEGKIGSADWDKLTAAEKIRIADKIFGKTAATTAPAKPAAPQEVRLLKPVKVIKHRMSNKTWSVRLVTDEGERFAQLFAPGTESGAETYAQELARKHNVTIDETITPTEAEMAKKAPNG